MSAREPDRDEQPDGQEHGFWHWARRVPELDNAFERNIRAAREAASGDLDQDPWQEPPAEVRLDDVSPC